MELRISENIYMLRKKKGMTQEQLAAALGVTFAAVSKWERGVSVPELKYVVAMADLFGISIDVLSGYRVQMNHLETLDEKIQLLTKKKDYDAAIAVAEKAVLCFPNDFNIIYPSAEACAFCGFETVNRQMLLKAIELFNQAIVLLSDNSNPQINEAVIRGKIAGCYIGIQEKKRGLKLLEMYNAGGMYHSTIGLHYAQDEIQSEKAVPFLNHAFAGTVSEIIRITTGYLNYYDHVGNTEKQLETLAFARSFLQSAKDPRHQGITYVDKLISVYLGISALLLDKSGHFPEAREALDKAVRLAAAFDRHPVYTDEGLRFTSENSEIHTVYDDIGISALQIIEKYLKDNQARPALMAYFYEAGGHTDE